MLLFLDHLLTYYQKGHVEMPFLFSYISVIKAFDPVVIKWQLMYALNSSNPTEQ